MKINFFGSFYFNDIFANIQQRNIISIAIEDFFFIHLELFINIKMCAVIKSIVFKIFAEKLAVGKCREKCL